MANPRNNQRNELQVQGMPRGGPFKSSVSEHKMRIMDSEGGKMIRLRVTGYCDQGGRPYMEDNVSLLTFPIPPPYGNEGDVSHIYTGVFDGHGGPHCSEFTRDNLANFIQRQPGFFSEDDDLILQAIRNGFLNLHEAMKAEREHWPYTKTGYPSTAGTTASVVFIRNGKIYIGHVGDSRIVMGHQESATSLREERWKAQDLTEDHKPENKKELTRILAQGGLVLPSSRGSAPRVVWRRPSIDHTGPIRRSTEVEEIPFLSVARSLGDYWSYNPVTGYYAVSPEPDVSVIELDPLIHRCIVMASDGVWQYVSSREAITIIEQDERKRGRLEENRNSIDEESGIRNIPSPQVNPSFKLVQHALNKWAMNSKGKADNISVMTIMIDYPDPVGDIVDPFEGIVIPEVIQNGQDEIEIDEIDLISSCDEVEVSSSDGESDDTSTPPAVRTQPLQSQVISSSKENVLERKLKMTGSADITDVSKIKTLKRKGKRKRTRNTMPKPRSRSKSFSSAKKTLEPGFQLPPKVMRIGDRAKASTSTGTSVFGLTTARSLRSQTRKVQVTPTPPIPPPQEPVQELEILEIIPLSSSPNPGQSQSINLARTKSQRVSTEPTASTSGSRSLALVHATATPSSLGLVKSPDKRKSDACHRCQERPTLSSLSSPNQNSPIHSPRTPTGITPILPPTSMLLGGRRLVLVPRRSPAGATASVKLPQRQSSGTEKKKIVKKTPQRKISFRKSISLAVGSPIAKRKTRSISMREAATFKRVTRKQGANVKR